jgi:small conductance mechanosensitive channel
MSLSGLWQKWQQMIADHGAEITISILHVIVIVIVGMVAIRLIKRALGRMERLLLERSRSEDEVERIAAEKRLRTLTALLRTVAVIGIWALVIVSGLNELGFNIGPLLAGAGIAGLAVGFGAQNLVRDVISGFFMILENQVRVGDVAVVNGTGGLVESITLRTIVLRDVEGVVHVFPHGSVVTLANRTMYWSAYVMDIGISYESDIDRAAAVMKEVYDDLAADPEFSRRTLEPIEVFGVDHYGPSELIIKARIKTRPGEQWTVGREYRRRLKYAFDRAGITIPFPQRTIHIQSAGTPPAGRSTPAA